MIFDGLDRHRERGVFFLRLIIGFHLIHGTADNISSWERMLEFARFLEAKSFPLPLPGAVLSAWAQFICGFLYILGALTRPAALIMTINFIAALLIAHRSGGYPPAALAFIMLFSSIFLFIHGPGAWSVDSRVGRSAAEPQLRSDAR